MYAAFCREANLLHYSRLNERMEDEEAITLGKEEDSELMTEASGDKIRVFHSCLTAEQEFAVHSGMKAWLSLEAVLQVSIEV